MHQQSRHGLSDGGQLRLQLLLLALFLPTQIFSNQTGVVKLINNSSQKTSADPNSTSVTTKVDRLALKSTPSLLNCSTVATVGSLPHLYCERDSGQ
uniref:Uncharacterized protein n=1 Tax=Urocitellus parryii TaxID=9999 RepID=A0A8D2IBG6_UROPR